MTSATGKLTLAPFPSSKNPSDEALHEASVQLDKALPGARYGMRAKVKLGS